MVSLGEQTKLNEETSNKLGNSYAAQAVYRKGAFWNRIYLHLSKYGR